MGEKCFTDDSMEFIINSAVNSTDALNGLNKAAESYADKRAQEKVGEALEALARKICHYCAAGWKFEVKPYGVYHNVPPKNAPVGFLNEPCQAAQVRQLASSSAKDGGKI